LIEPAAEIELNLTKFCRLSFGATYRLPSSFDIGMKGSSSIDAKSIKGVSYTVSLKLGKF